MTRRFLAPLACSLLVLAACGEREGDDAPSSSSASPAPAATAGGEQTSEAGRKIIVVEMMTDDQGNNVFRPANFEVHRGDVVRFTLKAGVHNVHFVADSNRAVASQLPPASELLQLPGQTWDLKVALPEGKYYYQCDPHALLGMVGHMEVEDEDDD